MTDITENKSRKKALVIAVSEYDESSELDNLPFCKNDGNEMLALLKDTGYEIKNLDGLVGHTDGTFMQDCIYKFFKDDIKSDDTLLFYYSGHAVPGYDDFFLSSSNIDQTKPKMRGFSFADLNGEITHCIAKRKVVILDSCHAGSLDLSSKGNESALATIAKNHLSTTFKEGEGKCLLASSMGFQASFDNVEGNHSFFTNYLLNGLRGADGKSVDDYGNVTPESLMQYIDFEIDKLPEDKRLQTPLRKIETAGKIILAVHPKFVQAEQPKKILSKIQIDEMKGSFIARGDICTSNKNYEEAIKCYSKALEIDPIDVYAIRSKSSALVRLGRYDEAIKVCDEGLKVVPNVGMHHAWIKNEKQDALEQQQIVLGFKEKPDPFGTVDLCFSKGIELSNLRKYEEAIEAYDKAINIDPNYEPVWCYKGLALFDLGKYNEAIEAYDKAISINPNYQLALDGKDMALHNIGKQRSDLYT